MRALTLPLLCAVALATTFPAEAGNVLTVPGDHATLEDAVAAALSGDTILISNGTYTPSVDITVDLTIRAADTPATVVFDGEETRRLLNTSATLTVEGITFVGGDADELSPSDGGAIRSVGGASLTVTDCVFESCAAIRGGAIYSEVPTTISGSRFFDCGARVEFPGPGRLGGGVMVVVQPLELDDVEFEQCRAYLGAGVHANGAVTVRDSRFLDNWTNSTGGGLMLFGNQDVSIEGSRFEGNTAGTGGGFNSTNTGTRTIRDCEFINNEGRQIGGGFSASNNGELLVEDCIFRDNTAVEQGGGGAFIYQIDPGITIRRCYFRNNSLENIKDPTVGGGALWLAENATGNGVRIEDSTFVENSAVRGSVAVIEALAPGSEFPVFERCIFAYNVSQSSSAARNLLSCGLPGSDVPSSVLQCSVLFANLPSDEFCTTDGGNVLVIDEARIESTLFCDDNYDSICGDSVAATVSCGGGSALGGLPMCAACATPVLDSTWGSIKNRYSTDADQ